MYLSLLHDGASLLKPSITHSLHPAAHRVSVILILLEEERAVRIYAADSAYAGESTSEARVEEARNVKNGMCMGRGEGGKGRKRQRTQREAFKRCQVEREGEWAREGMLACLEVVARLLVFNRMLRGEQRRSSSGDALEEETEPPITLDHLAASSSSQDPPFLNEDTEDKDPVSIPFKPPPPRAAEPCAAQTQTQSERNEQVQTAARK